jgi:hypothetical protein
VRLGATFRNSILGSLWLSGPSRYVALSMQEIDSFIQSRFPDNTGWYLIDGGWLTWTGFDAKLGPPPSPVKAALPAPKAAPAAGAAKPTQLRMFGAAAAGISPADLLGLVRNTLLAEWDMQPPRTEQVEPTEALVCQGDRRYGRGQQIRAVIRTFRDGPRVSLGVGFGDSDRWCSNDASAVVQRALLQINAALQVRFPGTVLRRLESN